jgi:FKBP-type peptidyl-prolyl cis-trans isomerase FkpA
MKELNFKQVLKFVVFLVLVGGSFSSCRKDKNYTFQDEMAKLKKYIQDNNITTKPTSSGLYFIETLAGTGEKARAGLDVAVRYKGYFLDGTVFDQNLDASEPFKFRLGWGYVIAGWDEGITYMREGGKATLIVPSSLAYSYRGTEGIPAYTSLIFEVELIKVY